MSGIPRWCYFDACESERSLIFFGTLCCATCIFAYPRMRPCVLQASNMELKFDDQRCTEVIITKDELASNEADEYTLWCTHLLKFRKCSKCDWTYTIATNRACPAGEKEHFDWSSEEHIKHIVIPYRIYMCLCHNKIIDPRTMIYTAEEIRSGNLATTPESVKLRRLISVV